MTPDLWLALAAAAFVAGYCLAISRGRRARRRRQASSRVRDAKPDPNDGERHLIQQLRAVAAERQRIFADLHDDVGAKLLTLIHTLSEPAHADLARSVLQDLRDIVSRSQLGPCSLLQALGQIHEETEQRLEIFGSTLAWQQAAELPDPMLDEASTLHLFRIVREAVSNAIRHGHATHLRIRVQAVAELMLLDITDDGPGYIPTDKSSGHGTGGMRLRAKELKGTVDWTAGTLGGTKVVLQFPLAGIVVQ